MNNPNPTPETIVALVNQISDLLGETRCPFVLCIGIPNTNPPEVHRLSNGMEYLHMNEMMRESVNEYLDERRGL